MQVQVQEGGARHGDVWGDYRYDANGDVWVKNTPGLEDQVSDIYAATVTMWEGHSRAQVNFRGALRMWMLGPCETNFREAHRCAVELIREVNGKQA